MLVGLMWNILKLCYEEVAVIFFCFYFSTSCFGEWKIFVNRDGAVKRYYNTESLEKMMIFTFYM